jgi:ABC-type antimicrobial peptide transport system permease subunit
MDDIVQGLGGLFIFRLAAILSAVLGLIGLTVGVVGVYGVVSYLAAERTHEIGIRIALGADREDILRMVCRQGLWIALAGVSVGLFLSLTLTRAMHKLLIGVSPSDPITYLTTISLISAVTLIACWIPASRATRVDPMVVLRCE